MIHWHTDEQGSEGWHDTRASLLTASNFGKAIGKPGLTRDKLMYQIAAAQLFGVKEYATQGNKPTPAMQRGTDLEPEARDMFELATGLEVTETGICTNDRYPGLGASPDGIITPSVGLEVKSPLATTCVEYLRKQRLPPVYRWQVYGQMLICEFEQIHFWVYHPTLPPLHILVERDEEEIEKLKTGLGQFMTELNHLKKELLEL